MILCKDCKNYRPYENAEYGNCFHDLDDKSGAEDSCVHAERADGLKVCCRDCKHYDSFWHECKKEYWTSVADVVTVIADKLSCPEWQAREAK